MVHELCQLAQEPSSAGIPIEILVSPDGKKIAKQTALVDT
jgi:hypothetical protein